MIKKVYLSNRGNPDFRQDPDRPIYGTKSDYFVEVKDKEDARNVVQQYIRNYNLGGGNWTGGHYFEGDEMVGYFSYNARYWDENDPIYTNMKKWVKNAKVIEPPSL
jgi:hypothetical protein